MSMSEKSQNVFGIVAEFSSPQSLVDAASQLKASGYSSYDAHSPFPIHGMDDAMGLKLSVLPWIVLFGGFFGLTGGFGLQTWVATTAYPLIISGKPLFSYPAFIPVTFELMILFSAFGAVFGMFFLNKIPMLYHPVFKHSRFYKVTSDGFFISVEAKDSQFDVDKTTGLLKTLGGEHIEVLEQ